jgi:hypothetical protein
MATKAKRKAKAKTAKPVGDMRTRIQERIEGLPEGPNIEVLRERTRQTIVSLQKALESDDTFLLMCADQSRPTWWSEQFATAV